MAAAYRHEGRPVPPELGEALGAVEYRRRAFQQIKTVIEEGQSGIGVKPLVERFLEDVKKHHDTIQRLIALHKDSPCP